MVAVWMSCCSVQYHLRVKCYIKLEMVIYLWNPNGCIHTLDRTKPKRRAIYVNVVNRQINAQKQINSLHTIKNHRPNMFTKLHAHEILLNCNCILCASLHSRNVWMRFIYIYIYGKHNTLVYWVVDSWMTLSIGHFGGVIKFNGKRQKRNHIKTHTHMATQSNYNCMWCDGQSISYK